MSLPGRAALALLVLGPGLAGCLEVLSAPAPLLRVGDRFDIERVGSFSPLQLDEAEPANYTLTMGAPVAVRDAEGRAMPAAPVLHGPSRFPGGPPRASFLALDTSRLVLAFEGCGAASAAQGLACADAWQVDYGRAGGPGPLLLGAIDWPQFEAAPRVSLEFVREGLPTRAEYAVTPTYSDSRWGRCVHLTLQGRAAVDDDLRSPAQFYKVCRGAPLAVEVAFATIHLRLVGFTPGDGPALPLGRAVMPPPAQRPRGSLATLPPGAADPIEPFPLAEGFAEAIRLDAQLQLFMWQHPGAVLHSTSAGAEGNVTLRGVAEAAAHIDRRIVMGVPGAGSGHAVVVQKRLLPTGAVHLLLSSQAVGLAEAPPPAGSQHVPLGDGLAAAAALAGTGPLQTVRITPAEGGSYAYQYLFPATSTQVWVGSGTGLPLRLIGPQGVVSAIVPESFFAPRT